MDFVIVVCGNDVLRTRSQETATWTALKEEGQQTISYGEMFEMLTDDILNFRCADFDGV
jgi:hypothetical protein